LLKVEWNRKIKLFIGKRVTGHVIIFTAENKYRRVSVEIWQQKTHAIRSAIISLYLCSVTVTEFIGWFSIYFFLLIIK